MYTKRFYTLFSTSCRLASAVGVVCFIFNPKTGTLLITRQQTRKYKVGLLFILLHLIFWGIRTLEMLHLRGGASNPDFHICYVYTLASFILFFGLLIIHSGREEVVQTTNQLLSYIVQFTAKWRPGFRPNKDPFSMAIDALTLLLIIVTSLGACLPPLFFIAFPSSPVHIYSLIEDKKVDFWWRVTLWCCNFLEIAWFSFLGGYAFLILLSIGTVYFFSIFPILIQELRGGLAPSCYKTSPKLRSVDNLVHTYHCIELMHNAILSVSGLMALHFHLCLSQFCLVCNFIIIKQWHDLDTVMTCMLLLYSATIQVAWAICLELAGRFHRHSRLTLASWRYLTFKSPLEKKFMSKFKKGCNPLSIGARGLFIIKKISVLKFLCGIVKGTFRALLTLGQESV